MKVNYDDMSLQEGELIIFFPIPGNPAGWYVKSLPDLVLAIMYHLEVERELTVKPHQIQTINIDKHNSNCSVSWKHEDGSISYRQYEYRLIKPISTYLMSNYPDWGIGQSS